MNVCPACGTGPRGLESEDGHGVCQNCGHELTDAKENTDMNERPTRLESFKAAISLRRLGALIAGYAVLVALQAATNVVYWDVPLGQIWTLRWEWFMATSLPWVVSVIVFDELTEGGESDGGPK